jgi:hypothetical protein
MAKKWSVKEEIANTFYTTPEIMSINQKFKNNRLNIKSNNIYAYFF